MDRRDVEGYLARLDEELEQETTLHLYGSAALMLLGEEGRTSLDIDVAAPHSRSDMTDLSAAAFRAGLPVNPPPEAEGPHIELVLSPRLCLPEPQKGREVLLFRGRRLTVLTSPPADLAASKLIRYDEADRSDIEFIVTHLRVSIEDIEEAAGRLPTTFRRDPVLAESLANLREDVAMWTRRPR